MNAYKKYASKWSTIFKRNRFNKIINSIEFSNNAINIVFKSIMY